MKLAALVSLLVIIPFQADAASCVGKKVDVWVVNGNNLSGDGLDYPDPYVLVKIGSDTRRTRTIYDEANPVWYQKLQFQSAKSELLRIEVWEADSGLRGDDDHLGTCMEQMQASKEYQNVVCKTKEGHVKLFYKCY